MILWRYLISWYLDTILLPRPKHSLLTTFNLTLIDPKQIRNNYSYRWNEIRNSLLTIYPNYQLSNTLKYSPTINYSAINIQLARFAPINKYLIILFNLPSWSNFPCHARNFSIQASPNSNPLLHMRHQRAHVSRESINVEATWKGGGRQKSPWKFNKSIPVAVSAACHGMQEVPSISERSTNYSPRWYAPDGSYLLISNEPAR